MGVTRMKLEHHSTKLVAGIGSIFDIENTKCKFSDVELKVNSWGTKTFHCHKLVLQLNSDHFANFSFPANRGPVVVNDIGNQELTDCLQFMYTGEIVLSAVKIEAILCAADILRMDDLTKVCFQFMENTLIWDDVVLCWRLAIKYKQDAIVQKCQREVKSEDVMKMLLCSENLHVKSEVEVCETFLKWVDIHSKNGSEIHHDHLLELIRWSGVSVEYVHAKFLQNTTLMSNPACQTFLSRVIRYMMSGIQFEGLHTFHRMSTNEENCVIVFGIDNDSGVSQDVYKISLQKPYSVSVCNNKKIQTTMSRESAACVMGNRVYVTGLGKRPYVETWELDYQRGWFKCADMFKGRRRHSVTVVDSWLYVLGGWLDNTALSSVECYNPKSNMWTQSGELTHAAYNTASAAYKNKIYIFGGMNTKCKALSNVQVYDPADDMCTDLDNLMPNPASFVRVVLWETSVILMSSYICLVYNFETKTWLERKQFMAGVKHFGLVLDNQAMYVLGGGMPTRLEDGSTSWTYSDKIKSTSILDIISNKPPAWMHHAVLPKPACIHAFGLICLPSNI